MKKNKKKWTGLMAAALAVTCVAGGTVLAAGDKNDPLVTLSYLEETVLPAILKQAEKTADSKKTELAGQFDQKLEAYQKQLNQGAAGGSDTATYSVVTLSKNQQLQLEVGRGGML